MRVFLEDQINKGNGKIYKEYMYDLAEVAFTVASRDLAREWYQKAYYYGVTTAIERYKERMKDFK